MEHIGRIYGAGPDHDQKPPGSNDPLQDLYIGQPVYNPPGTYQYAPEEGEMVLWVTNAGACDICTDNAEAGPVSYGTPFPSGDTEPPAHNHCFPAGTVISGPKVIGSTERMYSGSLIEIVTTRGTFLSVTPNHPILTPKGWCAAGLLKEGNEVISSIGRQNTPLLPTINPDDYQIPALIENVATTFCSPRLIVTRGMPTTTIDFHGDGIDTEVCIIRSNRTLRNSVNTTIMQPALQQLLSRRNSQLLLLPYPSMLTSLFKRLSSSTHSIMSRFCHSTALLFSKSSTDQLISLALSTNSNTSTLQPNTNSATTHTKSTSKSKLRFTMLIPGHNFFIRKTLLRTTSNRSFSMAKKASSSFITKHPTFQQDSTQGSIPNMIPTSNDLKRFAGDIIIDSILKISSRNFTGHVYNLQTTTGWYIANNAILPHQENNSNGIIVHNCWCSLAPAGEKPGPSGPGEYFIWPDDYQPRPRRGRGK